MQGGGPRRALPRHPDRLEVIAAVATDALIEADAAPAVMAAAGRVAVEEADRDQEGDDRDYGEAEGRGSAAYE